MPLDLAPRLPKGFSRQREAGQLRCFDRLSAYGSTFLSLTSLPGQDRERADRTGFQTFAATSAGRPAQDRMLAVAGRLKGEEFFLAGRNTATASGAASYIYLRAF